MLYYMFVVKIQVLNKSCKSQHASAFSEAHTFMHILLVGLAFLYEFAIYTVELRQT